MEIKATAKFVKTTPDKLRILSNLVMNKKPEFAITQLQFCGRNAAKYIVLVVKQGMDQIKSKDKQIEDFKITRFMVDEGPKLKRRRIRQQGRATAILKRMAHMTIVLSDDEKSKDQITKSKKNNNDQMSKTAELEKIIEDKEPNVEIKVTKGSK